MKSALHFFISVLCSATLFSQTCDVWEVTSVEMDVSKESVSMALNAEDEEEAVTVIFYKLGSKLGTNFPNGKQLKGVFLKAKTPDNVGSFFGKTKQYVFHFSAKNTWYLVSYEIDSKKRFRIGLMKKLGKEFLYLTTYNHPSNDEEIIKFLKKITK